MNDATVQPRTHSDLLDYAHWQWNLDGDHTICVCLTEDGRVGPSLRLAHSPGGTPGRTAHALVHLLDQVRAPIASLLTVHTGTAAVGAVARQVGVILARHYELRASIGVRGIHWHDLDTEASGLWTPGTSNLGLHLSMQDSGINPSMTAPQPAEHSHLIDYPCVAQLSDHVPRDLERAHAELDQLWPALLSARRVSDQQATQALRVLATPLLLTRTTALAALFPAKAGPAPTLSDIHAGMPQSVEDRTSSASESLLLELISRGPECASAGPLTALAWVAWLRGQGTPAHDLLSRARQSAQRHGLDALALQALVMDQLTRGKLSAAILRHSGGAVR